MLDFAALCDEYNLDAICLVYTRGRDEPWHVFVHKGPRCELAYGTNPRLAFLAALASLEPPE